MKKPGSYVLSIGTAVPPFRYRQSTLAGFMGKYCGLTADQDRKLKIIYRKSGIEFRHSVLPDFSLNGHAPMLFTSGKGQPVLSTRLGIYNQHALRLSADAVKNCYLATEKPLRRERITHLITVSCTGLSAPGLDIDLLHALDLPRDTFRHSVNFMGCYAGFQALRIADTMCRSDEKALVLIVMTELCSLHFQSPADPENMVVNSLFADGAAALLVGGSRARKKMKSGALAVLGFHGEVVREGVDLMKWNPSESGFLMGLDAQVPEVIEKYTGRMVSNALLKLHVKRSAISHWILHPGGRRILESAQRALKLQEKDLSYSYDVLRNFGNMSSPTVCFALQALSRKLNWKKKELILAAGFGPGITMETALLQPVRS